MVRQHLQDQLVTGAIGRDALGTPALSRRAVSFVHLSADTAGYRPGCGPYGTHSPHRWQLGSSRLSQAPTPLPGHPHRLPPGHGKPRRIEHQHPIALSQVPPDLTLQLLAQRRIVPRVTPNETLQRQAGLAKTIGNRCDVFCSTFDKRPQTEVLACWLAA